MAWGAGVAATYLWTAQSPAPAWPHALAAMLCLATGVFGLVAWWRAPGGILAWDGAGWTLAGAGGASASGRISRGADLQWLLLLRWHPAQGAGAWLWLERRQAPQAWDALRRAVYSRARTEAPQGAGGQVPPVSAP